MHVLIVLGLVLAACSASKSAISADVPPPIDGSADAPGPDGPLPSSDPCFPDQGADHVVTTCNGITFDIQVPPGCVAAGCGLIVDVHGLTMSAAMEDANTELRARASAAGYVVIQPNANPAPPQSSWSTSDDPKIYDFITRAIAHYHIDPKRVHMTGFSQGGFMTWRFLCDHADLFASVAPAAAASNCGTPACTFTGSELPSRQLAVLYMHGTQDQNYVPYSCAQPQVDAMVAAWGLSPGVVVASDATFTRTRWSNASGGLVELLAHDYSSSAQVPYVSSTRLEGHCYPGSTDPGNQPGQLFSFKCEQSASFIWGAEVLAFFQAHEMP